MHKFLLLFTTALFHAHAQPNADELTSLRQQLAVQQKQIDELRTALAEQRKLIDKLLPAPPVPGDGPLAGTPAAPPPAAAPESRPEAPLSFRIGAADFTPGGFLDFTSIYRSTNVGSGIGTSFGAIPLPNTPAGRLSESRFSAQNSRLALRVTAKPGRQTVNGYVEADFLGAQPPNAFVTSNSNSMRLRLYWVQVQRGRWEVLGGQSWSLLTPNRTGLSPVPSDLFYTQDMDTNYQVGLTWTRAPQFRLVYHGGPHWTAGFALENPEQYAGAGVVLPETVSSQLDAGANGTVPNAHPDTIGKIAYDGSIGGHGLHLETAGMVSGFRTLRAAGAVSHIHGFGGSLNGNIEAFRNFRLYLTTYLSEGGGRYIFGLGPSVVARPDGTLSPVHSRSGTAGFEYQATPRWLWFGYYGGAYFSRNFSLVAPGRYIGFGFPGAPATANRSVQEGTAGFVRTFWKNPNYGALQWITQYSYVTRSPWSAPTAASHIVYADLRYVLP